MTHKGDCLQCGGSGKIFFRTGEYIECDICKGGGLIKRNDLWEIQGLIIKNYRVSRELTLRSACHKWMIDPSNLSKMERGIIKPNPVLLRMIFDDN